MIYTIKLNLTEKDLTVLKKALEKSTSKAISQDIIRLVRLQEKEQNEVKND